MNNPTNPNASRKTVGAWLLESYEWRIPVYQRHYAWDPGKEFGPTQLFWEIIEEQSKKRLKQENVDPHYFGSILVESKTEGVQNIHKYDVVDGQQRLTTINIVLFAIIGIASQLECRKEVQDKLAPYIFNDPAPGDRNNPKLFPTNFDRAQFNNLLISAYDRPDQKHRIDNAQARKSRVVQARDFFIEEFKYFIKNHNPADVMAGIDALIDTMVDGFEFVLLTLKKTDEAQKVFESLNNTAQELTTFDLIRNNIFYRADKMMLGSDVSLFNSSIWQQFEDPFWEAGSGRSDKIKHIETYIARMLIAKMKQGLLLNRNAIYKKYKAFATEVAGKGLEVRDEVEIISEYVATYKYLVGEKRQNPIADDFQFGYFRYAICNSMDFYPTIFTMVNCDAPVEEKQRMFYLLESYIIRRHISHYTSENYNIQVAKICEILGDKPSYEKLEDFLKGAADSESRAFPKNEEIISACLRNNFYKSKLKAYIFKKIIYHSTADKNAMPDMPELFIARIIPKEWREKAGWGTSLKKFQPEDIDLKVLTIGNVTPMPKGLNTKQSNHDWDGKKGAKVHLATSDLEMTRIIADNDKWDLDDIDARSKELAEIICEIWPMGY